MPYAMSVEQAAKAIRQFLPLVLQADVLDGRRAGLHFAGIIDKPARVGRTSVIPPMEARPPLAETRLARCVLMNCDEQNG